MSVHLDKITRLDIQLQKDYGLTVERAVSFVRVLKILKTKEKTITQLELLVENLVDIKNKIYQEDPLVKLSLQAIKKVGHKCESCGGTLALTPITTPKGLANIKGWTMVDTCTDCQAQIFYLSDYEEEDKRRQAVWFAEVKRLKEKKEAKAKVKIIIPSVLKCPDCEESLRLIPIVEKRFGPKNRKGWRSELICWSCGYENFSDLSYKKHERLIKKEIDIELSALKRRT